VHYAHHKFRDHLQPGAPDQPEQPVGIGGGGVPEGRRVCRDPTHPGFYARRIRQPPFATPPVVWQQPFPATLGGNIRFQIWAPDVGERGVGLLRFDQAGYPIQF
jgi:hypothetical protein